MSDLQECTAPEGSISCGGPRLKRLRPSPGLATQCDDCGREEEAQRAVRRHVGLVGGAGINKDNAISIFRNPSDELAAAVAEHNGGLNNAANGMSLDSTSPPEAQDRD